MRYGHPVYSMEILRNILFWKFDRNIPNSKKSSHKMSKLKKIFTLSIDCKVHKT